MIKICKECNQEEIHHCKGMCKRCYSRWLYSTNDEYREKTREQARIRYHKNYETNKTRYIICIDCKQRRICGDRCKNPRCKKCHHKYKFKNNPEYRKKIADSKTKYRENHREEIMARYKAKIIEDRNAFFERYKI